MTREDYEKPMDINLDDLPHAIYACFVLHNYCEACKETVDEHIVLGALQCDQECQPPTQSNNYLTDCNEGSGKTVRRIVTKFLDP